MKKIWFCLILSICMLFAYGCGSITVSEETMETEDVVEIEESADETDSALEFVEGIIQGISFNDETLDCVCIYTQYTNTTGEAVMPADEVDVKAFQNGEELTIWVFTGTTTDGYIQCDTSVESGTTADVVWIFERQDDSEISVEFSDGQTFVIE